MTNKGRIPEVVGNYIQVDPTKVLVTARTRSFGEVNDPEVFDAFIESIKQTNGNVMPVPVLKLDKVGPNGEEYELLEGKRRLDACLITKTPLKIDVLTKPLSHDAWVEMNFTSVELDEPKIPRPILH